MGDFAQMRQALESGVIDAYVSERPEALTAESANSKFKMIQFKKGFEVGEEDATIAIGMKKGDTRIDQVNAALAKISSEDQVKLMDDMITVSYTHLFFFSFLTNFLPIGRIPYIAQNI